MDKHFKDGFERLLSDMEDAPTWDRVSTQTVRESPSPSRWRSPLVAVAAFAFTLAAIGSVVFLVGRGNSTSVAAEMVDYTRIEWSQDVQLRCVGMQPIDDGGFDDATIEIWGPNADGLVSVVATAPDGTADRLLVEYTPESMRTHRVWVAGANDGTGEFLEARYRSLGCESESGSETEHHIFTEAPMTPIGYAFGFFMAVPTLDPDGAPWDFFAEAIPSPSDTRTEEWRGIPVTVYTSGELAPYELMTEMWIDTEAYRFERYVQFFDLEDLVVGSVTTEVVERKVVPAGSASFSTEDLVLTFDDDQAPIVPTLQTDSAASSAALNWVNQTGLSQDDIGVWSSRLDLMCAVGYDPALPTNEMDELASDFIQQDAAVSVRSDGTLPAIEEATEALWIIVADPRMCPRQLDEPLDGLSGIDPAALETANDVEEAMAYVRGEISDLSDTTHLGGVIESNEVVIESGLASAAEVGRRQLVIADALAQLEKRLTEREEARRLLAELESRMQELRAES